MARISFDLLKTKFLHGKRASRALAAYQITETIVWLRNPKRDQRKLVSHREFIQLIGEPVLQQKLAEMFDPVTSDRSEAALIEKRMAALAQELNRVRTKKNNDVLSPSY